MRLGKVEQSSWKLWRRWIITAVLSLASKLALHALFAKPLARRVPTFVLTRSWNYTLSYSSLYLPAHSSSSSSLLVSLPAPCRFLTPKFSPLLWSVCLSLTPCSACFPCWVALTPDFLASKYWWKQAPQRTGSLEWTRFLFVPKTVITPACLCLMGEHTELIASFNATLRNKTLRVMLSAFTKTKC